jgi:hypothetical protein
MNNSKGRREGHAGMIFGSEKILDFSHGFRQEQ